MKAVINVEPTEEGLKFDMEGNPEMCEALNRAQKWEDAKEKRRATTLLTVILLATTTANLALGAEPLKLIFVQSFTFLVLCAVSYLDTHLTHRRYLALFRK